MKILSLIYLPTILAFNLNNLSRKEIISSSNINDKIMDDQNQESMIIET